jgi:hypothetical protein
MYSLISKEKMMKIVWSIICLQYYGSINKMNLNLSKIISKKSHDSVPLNALYGNFLNRGMQDGGIS